MNAVGRTENKTARRLLGFIDEFAKLDNEMQIQQIATYLHVMGKPGITMSDLAKATGLSSSSVSRNVVALSDLVVKEKPGHGLVRQVESPHDRRAKCVEPTAKGQRVFNTLIELLGK